MTTGLSEVELAPSAARVWDCLLGGATHARCDREVAAQIRAVAPWTAQLARQHRMFAWLAIRCRLAAGARQFGALFTVTDPGRLVAAWRERLASGSRLVIAHLTLEHVPPPLRPGVSYLCDWRPDKPGEVDGPARILGYGAVVRQL